MKDFKNKKVVITGAGSGIGKEIVNQFYQLGVVEFAVIGRDNAKLEALKQEFSNADFILHAGDVSQLNDIKNFASIISKKWSKVDILINNAGVVSAGAFESISDEDIIQQVNINVTGVILMTKHILPLLKKSSEAAIVNVSSHIALVGMAFYVPYAATKGAVKLFSEALRRELIHEKIQVMTVYPTATDTPMMTSAVANNLHTAKVVAEKTIEGLQHNAIDVRLGDPGAIEANKLNPEAFDEKAATMFDALKNRTANHRAM